jgi:hypothetical protein
VELHQGQISIDSVQDQGTTVTVSLPRNVTSCEIMPDGAATVPADASETHSDQG